MMMIRFFSTLEENASVNEAFVYRVFSEIILRRHGCLLVSNLIGSQDYSSLFPLDDTQPSKLMRLLSSNEDEPAVLSSPGESDSDRVLGSWFLQFHNFFFFFFPQTLLLAGSPFLRNKGS